MSMLLRLLAVMTLVGLVAAQAAGATPTVEFDRSCYVEGQGMHLTGGGYVPGGSVMLAFEWSGRHGSDGAFMEATVDAAGNLHERMLAPHLASHRDVREDGTVVGTDVAPDGAPPAAASLARFQLSAFQMWVPAWADRRADPRRRALFAANGFEVSGPVVYAHYLRAGRHVRTVRVGATRGPCGDLRVRMREFPFRPVPPGTYTVVFDTARRHPNPTPGIVWRSVRVGRSKAVR